MLTLTLKSHKVAGLPGLSSDDPYAVLQTQYALNEHTKKHALHPSVSLNTFILFPAYCISITFEHIYFEFIFSPH